MNEDDMTSENGMTALPGPFGGPPCLAYFEHPDICLVESPALTVLYAFTETLWRKTRWEA